MSSSPQAQKGVDSRGKPLQGLKYGKVTELSMFYKVKPGHEEQIRQAIEAFCTLGRGASSAEKEKGEAKIGIHELRLVLFDNDTRLLWFTSFDSDWDPYIDDTIAVITIPPYVSILQHTVEGAALGDGNVPNAGAAVKDLFNAVRVTAAGYMVSVPEVTITEQLKNRHLRQAFDKVLDNPDAAQALQHPALKPLLELAAD